MALGKQAKVITPAQQVAVLNYLASTRHPARNKVIFLLSLKAGLRAKEIACLTWSMVTDSNGQIADLISIVDDAAKGRSGGHIWMNKELKCAFLELYSLEAPANSSQHIVRTERQSKTSPQAIVNMFASWYKQLGFDGCSSHSGRRTFITNAAKRISTVGGSMRDVQMLARHASLNMTMRYIEADVEAMKKVVQLV